MNHPDDELQAYVDGELEPAARAGVEAHLRGCDACRAEVAALGEELAALCAPQVPDPGPRYWNEFASRVEARLPARRPSRLARWGAWAVGWLFAGERFAWERALSVAAACTVLIYVGMRGFHPAPEVGLEAANRAAPSEPAPPAPEAAPRTQDVPRALPPSAPKADRTLAERAPARPEERHRGRPLPAPGESPSFAPPPAPPGAAPTAGAEAAAKPRDASREREPAAGAPTMVQLDRQRAIAPPSFDRLQGKRPDAHPSADYATTMHIEAESLGMGPAAGDSLLTLGAWLQLDARFWPERDAPAARPTLVRIANGLARHPEDLQAVARARAYFAHLAATSASAEERAAWEERARNLPQP